MTDMILIALNEMGREPWERQDVGFSLKKIKTGWEIQTSVMNNFVIVGDLTYEKIMSAWVHHQAFVLHEAQLRREKKLERKETLGNR
jgi:hypothetical protein